jgi:hypothetical protein
VLKDGVNLHLAFIVGGFGGASIAYDFIKINKF